MVVAVVGALEHFVGTGCRHVEQGSIAAHRGFLFIEECFLLRLLVPQIEPCVLRNVCRVGGHT